MSRGSRRLGLGTALAACLAALLAPSCGGPGGSAARPAAEVRRHMVRHQQARLHQRLFFVAMGEDVSQDMATAAAYKSLAAQLTWLPARSHGLLEGLYRVDQAATDDEGRVHVLAVLEREAAADLLRRRGREAQQRARGVLSGCERHLAAAEMERAVSCHASASAIVAEARVAHDAARAALGEGGAGGGRLAEEDMVAKLGARIVEARSLDRSITLHVPRLLDGVARGNADSEIGALVTGSGFRLAPSSLSSEQVLQALSGGDTSSLAATGRGAGAGFALVGTVEAHFSAEEMGQFFAHARADLRIIETASGRTIATLVTPKVKGGHVSRQASLERALDNLLQQLASILPTQLRSLSH